MTTAADEVGKMAATTVLVTRQHVDHGVAKGAPETILDETVAVHRFVTQPATVSAEVGLTINIGNYESVRVHIGVSVPCYKEEVEGAYLWAKEFVESRVKADAADVRATALASKSNPSY
jgi:hypothetical protein